MEIKHTILSIMLAVPLLGAAQGFNPSQFSIAYTPALSADPEVAVSSSLIVDLETDKVCYPPGQTVRFKASTVPAGSIVRYRHGADVIKEEPMLAATWDWTPPTDDFTGYMVDIYQPMANGELILGAIAVDVSSDWARFPRYGFVATFDGTKLVNRTIEKEMAYLNRLHINGVQFQDWHWKHHWPLGGTRDQLMSSYTDIANRRVYTNAIKKYIEVQHGYGMKTMFYNLCYGALTGASADGVKEKWYVFKDDHHGDKDYHNLPEDWKSNIFVVNPANPEWQAYLNDRNDDVYYNFDFDGFHIDQLGWRGDLYDYYGNHLDMPTLFPSFLNAMKERHPDKRLVMNVVGTYAQWEVASSPTVDFCYNECWWGESTYEGLYYLMRNNDNFSNHTKRTVFAAYMNYGDIETGYMNTPGVLLTDAVMLAMGASHLEMGDHMLSSEYFPHDDMQMTPELRQAMIHYYDFMTAYENLLRGGTTADEFNPDIRYVGDDAININAWPPQGYGITAYARNTDGKQVYQLLNFLNTDDLNWRDVGGTRQEPREVNGLTVRIKVDGQFSKIWAASPDYHGGVAQLLPFSVADGYVTVTVPALKYWTMLVVE